VREREVSSIARRGPVGLTITDLLALAFGTSVALALTWYGGLDEIGQWLSRSPYNFFTVVFGRASFALIPLILLRRVRYGGLVRPAEFLILCCGLPELVEAIDFALQFSLQNQWLYIGKWLAWTPANRWMRRLLISSLSILAFVGWCVTRERMPGWLQSIVLGLAWCGAFENVPLVILEAFTNVRLMLELGADSISNVAQAFERIGLGMLWACFYALPFALVLRSLRRDSDSPYWAEWLGLFFAVALFFVSQRQLVRNFLANGQHGRVAMFYRATSMFLAFAACVIALEIRDRLRTARKESKEIVAKS
jgi:hypothetical protein